MFRMKFHDQKTLSFSFQKQPFADNFQNSRSETFCDIHKKTPVLELRFNKVATLENHNFMKKRFQCRCFIGIWQNF